uniref:Nicastrin n=1 Tax=Globodera rostochiensis TaxID=31243 RepID=A0A914GZ24_GLORO
MFPSNISLFLLVLLLECFIFIGVDSYANIQDQIFIRVNNSEVQCIRMLNGTDSIGCQSDINGNVGALTTIAEKKDVQSAVDNLPFGISNIIAVVALKKMRGPLIDVLRSHEKVVGILLIDRGNERPSNFSEDAFCPNRQFSFYPTETTAESCHGWNQGNAIHPDGLKFVNFAKPLRLATNEDEIKLIVDKCLNPFNNKLLADGFRCMGRMTQFMFSAGNAKICLERYIDAENSLCEVLEDLNVFLMLPSLNMSQPDASVDQFVLAARMDTFSTFRNTKGGDLSALSSLMSLLLAADASGRQLLFAFLHGESLGYIGSSRWMWDMEREKFPAEAKNFTTKEYNVRQIGVDALSFFMELQQIGASSKLYAHTDSQIYNQNKSLVDTILHYANGSGEHEHVHFVDPTTPDYEAVPPSSYHSILKTSTKVPGLILSSFGPGKYQYGYVNSFLDDQIRSQPKHMEEYLHKIIDASNIALRAALSYVFNDATESAAFKVNDKYAEELGNCFFKTTWSCPLFRTLTNATHDMQMDQFLNETANSFLFGSASGRLRHPIIRRLIFSLLTLSTGDIVSTENVRTQSQCRDLNNARNDHAHVWMNDRDGKAHCYRASIYQTLAKSPAFDIKDYNFTSGKYSTWVASHWAHEATFELYLKADYRLELYAFVTAFVVLMLCIPLLFAPKEQWFLDNFLRPDLHRLMVRRITASCFRAPWPFEKKGQAGWHKIGPVVVEAHKWPGQQKEFPELSPKFMKNNHKALSGYTGVQPTGYNDPVSGEYVHVPEMVPELVVPDLSNFELKPYVSYKADSKIEERLRNFEKKLAKYGGNEQDAIANSKETELWPPPPIDAKVLFDFFYAEKIRQTFTKEKKKHGKT